MKRFELSVNNRKKILDVPDSELWTTFARTGKPGRKDAPVWLAYNLKHRPTMRIDTSLEVINNRSKEEVEMWRSIGKI